MNTLRTYIAGFSLWISNNYCVVFIYNVLYLIRQDMLCLQKIHACNRPFVHSSFGSKRKQGGGGGSSPPQPPPPPKIGKHMIFFGVKSWFFTWNTPKIFAPPSARRNFFNCVESPSIRLWTNHFLVWGDGVSGSGVWLLVRTYRIYLKVDEQISFFFKIYIGWLFGDGSTGSHIFLFHFHFAIILQIISLFM
jgi:hypothetical protein